MPVLIKNVRGKHRVEFDQGAFDSWCVFLKLQGSRRYPPHDTEYFQFMQKMGEKYGRQRVYDDFVQVYSLTNNTVDESVLGLITQIADTYQVYAMGMDIWLTVIYAGMIAEENKSNAILKKRIKRLGMHQVLLDGVSPEIAANFSRNKPWRELDLLMKGKGF